MRLSGKKSLKRSLLLEVCTKIIGKHWADNVLRDYLVRNAPKVGNLSASQRWNTHFKGCSFSCQKHLEKGRCTPLLIAYFSELTGILNSEIVISHNSEKGETSRNALSLDDRITLVHFLGGTGAYGMYRSDFFSEPEEE
jgi:hypothetical protein